MQEAVLQDIIPQNEAPRLDALYRYEIVNTPPEESFNNIAGIMAEVFNAPIALVSLVDKERVFFKGNVGMPGVRSTDRTESLCAFAVLSSEPTIFDKPLEEPCLLTNPLVHGEFGLRFYAGAPLTTPDGYNIGSVCIVDRKERSFSERQQNMLVKFAKLVMHEIEMRVVAIRQGEVKQQLRLANEELNFVTDTMPQLVWAAEANGHVYFLNKRWFEYTGSQLEKSRGDGWVEALHPEDVKNTLDAWRKAVALGGSYEVEYRLKRYDGVYHWFLGRGTPMKDKHGQTLKWYGTTTDINDQKNAEQALVNSKERFDLVAKATQDALWDWDLIANCVWWNEGFKELFGYDDDEIEDTIEFWYNRMHPDDKEKVVAGIHDVIDRGGKHWSAEYRFRRKDGTYAVVYDRGYALHDETGKPYRLLGSMQDITDRKHFEEALKESEARTRLAVASARIATFQIDVEKQTILHSPRLAEIFGLDASKQWPYQTFINAVYPDDKSLREKAHAVARKTGNLFYEVRIVLPDNSIRWVRLNGALATMEAKPFLIGTALDITEEKEAANFLEIKIQERTAELQAANNQLKQFSYAASHDLQEPLRKISFFTDRLITGLGPLVNEENKKIAERIRNTTTRMRNLIDDLLDYSNISLGATAFEVVDLRAVVNDVLSDMEGTIFEKGADINVVQLPCVNGNYRQLYQLFQNLISNGVKYHKADETPKVELTYRVVDGEAISDQIPIESRSTTFFEISIKDFGIGFSQMDEERIFHLFQRLHGRAEYEGTGVGLAIVKKVIENHKGFIWAESEPEKGATFKVLLPALESSVVDKVAQ